MPEGINQACLGLPHPGREGLNDEASREVAALSAGRVIVQGLTVAAGVMVAISGACAAIGLAFTFGYLTTIGAPWATDLIPITTLIQFGAPFASVVCTATLCALLIYGRNGRLPRAYVVALVWVLCLVFAGALAVWLDWSSAYFLLNLSTGLAIGLLGPALLIRLVVPWANNRLRVLAMLIYAPALVILPATLIGVAKGFSERTEPEVLSRVVIAGEPAAEDWRLVMVMGDKFFLTRVGQGVAFRTYKLLSADRIESIQSSRAGAPWAPKPE